MNCKHSENDLALYIEGDLSETKAEEVDIHLLACSVCRQIVDELRGSQALVKSIRREAVSTAELAHLRLSVMERLAVQRPKAFWGRWVYALAGTAFLVVLMVGVLARYRDHHDKSAKLVETAPMPPAVQTVFPESRGETQNVVKVNVRRRVGKNVIRPKVPAEPLKSMAEPLKSMAEPLKSMMVKLQTDDPNVVIYWLFDQDGGSL